jgi:hypothetical protein
MKSSRWATISKWIHIQVPKGRKHIHRNSPEFWADRFQILHPSCI